MVFRPETLCAELQEKSGDTKLKAIRKIKNQVIGNKRRKRTFNDLHVIQSLVDLLEDQGNQELHEQCAILLSSLSRAAVCNAESRLSRQEAISKTGPALLKLLQSSNQVAVIAALRALDQICQVSKVISGSLPSKSQLKLCFRYSTASQRLIEMADLT